MLRVLLTPRWLGWTLFAVLAVGVCGLMTWWQVVRLESPGGSLLNAGYAFQWPLFALFFAFLWWRMLRAEARPADPESTGEDGAPATAVRAGRVEPVRAPDAASPFGPRPSGVDVDREAPAAGSLRARHNAHFAELAHRAERARRGAAQPTPEDHR